MSPVIGKCQLCTRKRLAQGKMPACVESCPTGALKFGQRNTLLFEAQSRIKTSHGRYVNHIYGENEAGGTAWLYLSDTPFENLGFKTDVDVVAGPHHRNAQGMLDSHRIMAASSPEDALRGLREREIDFVAFCITESWIPLVPPDSSGTFYNALVEDRPPPWLRRIPLEGIGESYRLYQVLEGANTG